MAVRAKGGAKAPKTAPAAVDSRAARGTLETGEADLPNWADKPESAAYTEAAKLYPLIQKAYDNKLEQADRISEYWKIYNAEPDENLQYSGNSQSYIPAVRDAINARAKRTVKQLFPARHKHIDAVGSDDEIPYAQLALLEQYIRQTNLKDLVRSVLVSGDVTGQWNLYIDWTKSYRRVTELVRRNPILAGVDGEEIGLADPTEEEEATEEKDVFEEGPDIVDFATEDLAVVPPTVNDLEKARATSIKLRMSSEKVLQMVDEGVFILPEKGNVARFVDGHARDDGANTRKIPPKQRTNEAGIRTEGTYKYALIYEVAAMLDFEDAPNGEKSVKRLGLIYFAGENEILGIIKAPWWGGRRPMLSAPVERISGSFFGQSKIEPVKFLQWNLVDYWNMGQDSAQYSLLPIVMTDPLKNPNYQTMVIGLAAVWATSPNDTKFQNFPQLWKDAAEMCGVIKRQIWESLDVNEMMMGLMPQGRKNNQLMGQMQQEQMTNIMDHAERFEEAILNPLVERMFEYDQQFRSDTLTVMTKGEVGVKAKMTDVPPQQWGVRFFFQWAGTAFVMGMQRMQQQIAWMNVLRGIPPQQLNGRRLDVTPIIELGTENIFGPEIAPKILIDERNLFTVDPDVENEILNNGMPVDVHESDDDARHLAVHQSGARLTGDPNGNFRAHIAKHMMSLNMKRQKAMAAQQPGQPGAPGPSSGTPGLAGSPRVGAQPGAPRQGAQNPPGAIAADAMPGIPGRG